MSSTSEIGHAKNVANLQTLITYCTSLGAQYNPTKKELQIPQLQTLYTNAFNTLQTIQNLHPNYSQAVANRKTAFTPLPKLTTRITLAYKASDTTPNTLENIKTITRKIKGERAKPLTKPTDPNTPDNHHSVAQLSYDNQIDHLAQLIQALTSEPGYQPNEPELQTPQLQAYYNTLQNCNNQVATTVAPLSNARIARNQTLYHPTTGLVPIALQVKTYIQSLFGSTSPQYKQISKLNFSNKHAL